MCDGSSVAMDVAFANSRVTPTEIGPKQAARKKHSRRKLWQLPAKLHCPVIGTCLEVSELRRLLRKIGSLEAAGQGDYKVHVCFVSTAGTRTPHIVEAHKAMEKKYAGYVRRFTQAKSAEQLAQLWQDALDAGEAPGGLWALVTHPCCDDRLTDQAFMDIHMLSHQIGAGQRADLKRLARVRSELERLEREHEALSKRSRQQIDSRDHRIVELEQQCDQARQEITRRDATVESLSAEVGALREQTQQRCIAELERKCDHRERQLEQLQLQVDTLQNAYDEAHRKLLELEASNQEISNECAALERLVSADDEQAGDDQDLKGRHVLCVGGRCQLIRHFESLVKQCNGEFSHHDGGREDSRQRLPAMLSAADAVVCAADAVSHDAYYRLKRFCKQYDKQYVYMQRSGISAFARALETVAAR